MLALLTLASASAIQVVEHAEVAAPSPPELPADFFSEPWGIAALIFVSVLLLLVFARCIFSVCEITCDREDVSGVATQSAIDVGLSRA